MRRCRRVWGLDSIPSPTPRRYCAYRRVGRDTGFTGIITGYGSALAQKQQDPVVPRFYGGGEDQPLSFVELIELLFVSKFRLKGLSMQYIRKAAAIARTQFETPYPFAVGTKPVTI